MREKGYFNVWTPYAELYHYESLLGEPESSPEKQATYSQDKNIFQQKWQKVLANGDPYYNPNLTLKKEDFSLRLDKDS
jgi:hypothetical protein